MRAGGAGARAFGAGRRGWGSGHRQVPAGAPSSSRNVAPRASTVEGEPASARRVRGWHDEAVDACGAETKTRSCPRARNSPPARHPAQQRRSASSARPYARNEADTCARVEAEVRGHGEQGAVHSPFCGWHSREAWISVAPHLPTADSGYSDSVRTYSGTDRRVWFS